MITALISRRLNHREFAAALGLPIPSDLQKIKVKVYRGDFPDLVFPAYRDGGYLVTDVNAFKVALEARINAQAADPQPPAQPTYPPRERRSNIDRRK